MKAGFGRVLTTKDPKFQNSIGQRVELSYYDKFKVNQAYCQGNVFYSLTVPINHWSYLLM